MISLSTTCFICLFFIGSLAEGDPTPGERLLGMEKTAVKDEERDRRNLQYGLPTFFDSHGFEQYSALGATGGYYYVDPHGNFFYNNPNMMAGLNNPGNPAMGNELMKAGLESPTEHLDEMETVQDTMNDHRSSNLAATWGLPTEDLDEMETLFGAGWGSTVGSTSDAMDTEERYMGGASATNMGGLYHFMGMPLGNGYAPNDPFFPGGLPHYRRRALRTMPSYHWSPEYYRMQYHCQKNPFLRGCRMFLNKRA